MVNILTDGSGSDGVPRIEQTLQVLREADAPIGPLCGQLSDRAIYQHILAADTEVFVDLCERVTDMLVQARIDTLVSDGIEGYNPTHDLCHAVAGAAVISARQRHGVRIRHWCIPLMGDPRRFADGASPVQHEIELDDALFDRKMKTIYRYASQAGSTLQREVDETMQAYGPDAFRRECFFDGAVPSWAQWSQRFLKNKPYYETYGQAQVAAGRYKFLISFQEHMQPLIDGVHRRAERAQASVAVGSA